MTITPALSMVTFRKLSLSMVASMAVHSIFCSSSVLFSSSTSKIRSILADLSEFVRGTCVYMSLSNSSNKDTAAIFDRYADADSGFTKTRIPLKNIYDSSPVSRSQAKRLCNRMDRFEEVTLDFDGLEWMGQGFAHQLFVVFKHEHPEVRLLPENMNTAVEKMYLHVLSGE